MHHIHKLIRHYVDPNSPEFDKLRLIKLVNKHDRKQTSKLKFNEVNKQAFSVAGRGWWYSKQLIVFLSINVMEQILKLVKPSINSSLI